MSKRQNEAPRHLLVHLTSASGLQRIGRVSSFGTIIPEVSWKHFKQRQRGFSQRHVPRSLRNALPPGLGTTASPLLVLSSDVWEAFLYPQTKTILPSTLQSVSSYSYMSNDLYHCLKLPRFIHSQSRFCPPAHFPPHSTHQKEKSTGFLSVLFPLLKLHVVGPQ